jgi:chaperonin GroES
MKLLPLGDRVVLKPIGMEETTQSGIVIPGQSKEKTQQATVVAVGPGGLIDGYDIEMHVKVGQKVVYPKFIGTVIEMEDEEYIIVRQGDLLAVVEA